MKVLVTGGAGYIGSTLVPMLLGAGHEVHVVDSMLYQENSLGGVAYHPRFSVTVGDVRDQDLMRKVGQEAEVVVPLAAIVGAPACDRDVTAARSVNRDAVVDMLGWLRADQYVIMPTTNSGYGQGEADHYCDERTPLRPLSGYAREKALVEECVMERGRSISLRLATVFGMSPRMRVDLLVNDFVNRALRDRFLVLFESGFYRNYIHVRDVARVFLFALDRLERMSGEIYNVGLSEANLTKRELAERIRAQLPELVIVEATVGRDPDQRNYVVSNAKIESVGFRPEYGIDQGIGELIQGIPMLWHLRHANA